MPARPGILLAAAVVVALVWANSPWSAGYHGLWSEDVRHVIDDGLMTLFFFAIGLEIKQELVEGQLRSVRRAAVPIAGALGGMIVPALLYAALNAGGEGASGWGIPMATDVVFAVGVLAMLGARVPSELKVLMLGLAVVDDIGAIAVIAVFYSHGLSLGWVVVAVAGIGLVAAAKHAGIGFAPVYVAIAGVVWFATDRSGIHATIAGVALALLVPASTAERLKTRLDRWTSYVIVPLFALSSAGITITASTLGDAVTSPVAGGVVVGLVVGKLVGVAGAIALVTRWGWGHLPDAVTPRHIVGMAAIAGIGFTVSIFVAGLAFDRAEHVDEAKLGILVASVLAAVVGTAILTIDRQRRPPPRPL